MASAYSKITVLVDMDDTIEHLLPAWLDWLNAQHGTKVSAEDVTEWEIEKFFPTLTKEEVFAPLFKDEFWLTVTPRQDAMLYLLKLMELEFDLYICTTSNYKTIRSKLEHIIDRYFPFIPWERVITTSNKQLLKADILVDDGIHNLVGGAYKKILMSAPHNKNCGTDDKDIIRVNNWREAYEKILDYSDQILENHCGEGHENN